MLHPKRAILHCSATLPDWMEDNTPEEQADEIRRWHVDINGWLDTGYHFFIAKCGTVVECRPLRKQGAHVRGHNDDSIGICLAGGHGSAETDKFSDHFTDAQDESVRNLCLDLMERFDFTLIEGHNQHANKACPGFHVPTWWGRGVAASNAGPVAWYRWRLAELRDLADSALKGRDI